MDKRRFTLLTLSAVGIAMTAVFYLQPPIHLRQPFLLIVFIVMYYWLLWRNQNTTISVSRLITSMVVAFAWLYSSHTQVLGQMNALQWILLIGTFLTISSTVYFGMSELETPFRNRARQVRRRWLALYAVIPLAAWTPYLLAYYPAKMNADSFWQWAQAHRITQFDAWHPVLDTWIIQGCAWIYNSPVSYIVLQMLILAVVTAYALYLMESLGMPRMLVLLLDFIYALNPANGFLAITMWKDILFAASILLVTILLVKVEKHKGWLTRKRNIAALILAGVFAMALRHNGPEAVLASLLLFIAVGKGLRLKLTFITAATLALFIIYTGPVKGYFHVIPEQLDEALAIPSQQIAATYKYNGTFTPKLKSYFDAILPAKHWAKDYSPYTVNPVKWDPSYNEQVIYASFSKYLINWAALLRLNPGLFVRAYLRQVAPLWQLNSPGMHPYLDTPATLQSYPLRTKLRAPASAAHLPPQKMMKKSYQVYAHRLQVSFPGRPIPSYHEYQQRVNNTLGPLKTTARFGGLRKLLNKVFNGTRYHLQNYLVKGAMPFFLIILGLAASIRRFGMRGSAVYFPAVFVVVTLAMAMPATDFRYSFGFALSAPLLLFYAKLGSNLDQEES